MRVVLFLLLLFVIGSLARRRISSSNKAFDDREDGLKEFEADENSNEKKEGTGKKSSRGSTTTTEATETTTEKEERTDDNAVKKLLLATSEISNLTKLVEEENADSLEDNKNRTVLWIDASYKAIDYGLDINNIPECLVWQKIWNKTANSTQNAEETNTTVSSTTVPEEPKETELISTKKRLKKLGLNETLIKEYKAVGIVYKEICAGRSREMWYSSTEDARTIGVSEKSPICEPFKEALNPDITTLANLAQTLDDIIQAAIELKADHEQSEPSNRTSKEETRNYSKENLDATRHSTTSTSREKPKSSPKSEEHTTTPKTVNFDSTMDEDFDQEQQFETDVIYRATHEDSELTESSDRRPHVAVVAHIPVTTSVAPESSESGNKQSTVTTQIPTTDSTEDNFLDQNSKITNDIVNSTSKKIEKSDKQSDEIMSAEYHTEDNLARINEEQIEKDKTQTTKEGLLEKNEIKNYDDDIWDYEDMASYAKQKKRILKLSRRIRVNGLEINYKKPIEKGVLLRVRRMADEKKKDSDEDWIDILNEGLTSDVDVIADAELLANHTLKHYWLEINATDEINPTLLISTPEAIDALGLNIPKEVFLRHEKVGLYLPGICADYVPKAIDAFNSSSFEGIEIEGPIGVNISALEAAGVNLTALAEKLRNDTEVDDILSRTEGAVKTLGGSFILPVLNKNQYDPFSAPIVFQGSAVVVRFGIYIESMSNFQTTTMDYDMDIYLMMAWRDARLVNPYDKPILVKEEEILEKIWRPDPFFANAKEAEFHEVTFLNFLMRIFPDGLVLYETRVKITPSCNLILCKYPHDKQTCHLLIKSFAYPVETVRFEWFSRRTDAIDKNPEVKLPELYIDRYEPTLCNRTRKSGAFSCLRAVFLLKRDVGFHMAQTYIPTSLALMFSWVGVWLPEEFMEGRIGVAITVLLTLSTESAGAREHLPSVSYLKAIDLWFGFITGFVFFTLLQTLFVIGFDKRANQLRKWATKKRSDMNEEIRDSMIQKAKQYHKIGRYLDNFCRVFYPLSFLLFLIMYYFVFTEGRQDDCINRR